MHLATQYSTAYHSSAINSARASVSTNFTKTLLGKRSGSTLSMHAQKENDNLRNSLAFLDNNSSRMVFKNSNMEETDRLIQNTKTRKYSTINLSPKLTLMIFRAFVNDLQAGNDIYARTRYGAER